MFLRTGEVLRFTDDDLFLRMDVSRNTLYVGESLTATLKVYARVNLVDVQGKKIPPFDGFLTEDVKIPQIHLEREEYNGKIYDRVGGVTKNDSFPATCRDVDDRALRVVLSCPPTGGESWWKYL